MQRTLYLVRHAKSSWEYPLEDIARPLAPRGVKEIIRIADALRERQIMPQRLISSDAVRALCTATILLHKLSLPLEILHINHTIYSGTASDYAAIIQLLPEKIGSVMLVGHESILSDTARQWLASPPEKIPTSAVLAITWKENASWQECAATKGKLKFFLTPKKYN